MNLLRANDRRSAEPGDSAAAVEARFRLEERGVGEAQVTALSKCVGEFGLRAGAVALDVGAGTGKQIARLASDHEFSGVAVDLATRACELGSRKRPQLNWFVANADRVLPFFDGTFDLIMSSVGPKHPQEFRRLLTERGELILLVAGADDLIELRAAVQGAGNLMDRVAPTLQRFAPHFDCRSQSSVRTRLWLEPADLQDLLASTYRGARSSERDRAAALERMQVTFSAEILRLQPR